MRSTLGKTLTLVALNLLLASTALADKWVGDVQGDGNGGHNATVVLLNDKNHVVKREAVNDKTYKSMKKAQKVADAEADERNEK